MQSAKILNLDFLFLLKDVLKSCAAQPEERTSEDQRRPDRPTGNGLMGYDAAQSAGKTGFRRRWPRSCSQYAGRCQLNSQPCYGKKMYDVCHPPWNPCCTRGNFYFFM